MQRVEQVHVYDSSCFFVWLAVFLEGLVLLQCSEIKQHPILVRGISGKALIMAARWPNAVTHKGFPKGFLLHIIRVT